jgi:hypothetical protein
MTERASYTFTVKEHGDGTPFLMLEPRSENLRLLDRGFLSFDLLEGTSYEQAQEIAGYMSRHLRSLAYTSLA